MRIDPTGVPSVTPGQVGATQRGSTRPAGATAPAEGAGSFTPTPDLARLLDAVRQLPEVREGVVQDVSARLAAGELHTPAAAAETAGAIVDATTPPGG